MCMARLGCLLTAHMALGGLGGLRRLARPEPGIAVDDVEGDEDGSLLLHLRHDARTGGAGNSGRTGRQEAGGDLLAGGVDERRGIGVAGLVVLGLGFLVDGGQDS